METFFRTLLISAQKSKNRASAHIATSIFAHNDIPYKTEKIQHYSHWFYQSLSCWLFWLLILQILYHSTEKKEAGFENVRVLRNKDQTKSSKLRNRDVKIGVAGVRSTKRIKMSCLWYSWFWVCLEIFENDTRKNQFYLQRCRTIGSKFFLT